MAKLFFLKHKDGRFATIENNQPCFTQKLSYGRFCRTYKEAENKKPEMEFLLNSDLEIFESTEEEFMLELQNITVQAILAGEYYKQLMIAVNYNLPTISQINKNLKNVLKNSIEHMKKVTQGFEEFEKVSEDAVYEVQGHYQETILLLSELPLHELGELNLILKAYAIDKKSIEGICKKILKNK